MRSVRRVSPLVGLIACCAALFSPRPSSACGNAISLEEENTKLVGAADRKLTQGKHKESAELLMQYFPKLKTVTTNDKLVLRARRVVALTVVRTDGLLPIPAFAASTSEGRRQNLEWAARVMRESNDEIPNSPVIQAGLGEALAKLPEHMAEAFALLDNLARKDVLPSAHAYHALAHMRQITGDEGGARSAMEKVAQLTASPLPTEGLPPVNPNSPRRPRRWR